MEGPVYTGSGLRAVGAKTNYHSAHANLSISVCRLILELWIVITNTLVV